MLGDGLIKGYVKDPFFDFPYNELMASEECK